MPANKRAVCPCCHRTTGTYLDEGRRFYIRHHTGRGRTDSPVCEATGWLVEGDELVVTPRGPSPLAGIAQPSRADAWVHRCVGGRPECTRRNPCSDGCRPYPPEPRENGSNR